MSLSFQKTRIIIKPRHTGQLINRSEW